eukprot:GHRR01010287.1.p1 GENE.GHRR01010287.1~~GHRR01010287.1.p1  ORF type:complete len:191 (+),score=42.95 GHRR01010287.1:166-738(+)
MLQLNRVKSWTFAGLCAVAAVTCLLLFKNLQSQINAAAAANGYTGPSDKLKVLDLRFGYSPDEVEKLFRAWGPRGRQVYVMTELLDILVYFAAYGGLFLVLFNRLGALAALKTSFGGLRDSYIWVMLLVVIDAVENCLQLLLVLKYSSSSSLPAWWYSAVKLSSSVNQLKWWVVRFLAPYFVLVTALAVF